MRPVDWHVLDLERDPTPGEPFAVRSLAARVLEVGQDAAAAERDVRSLAGDGSVLSWIGLAGQAFRGALADFPTQLVKLADSYEQAGQALGGWAQALDGAQDQADRALELGRQARAELDALTGQLSSAQASAGCATAQSDRLRAPAPAGAPPPDPAQVRAAVAGAQAASSRVAALSGQVGDAQGRLDAAKRMAADARELRDDAADRTAERLREASDAGIEPNSWWGNFKSAAAQVWDVAVKVATVVAIVVAVIALFVGGPLVWGILLAASLVLLADSMTKYARGDGSLWEVGLNLLGVIPGGRLLTALDKVAGLSRIGTKGVAGLTAGAPPSAGWRRPCGVALGSGWPFSVVRRAAPVWTCCCLVKARASRRRWLAGAVYWAARAPSTRGTPESDSRSPTSSPQSIRKGCASPTRGSPTLLSTPSSTLRSRRTDRLGRQTSGAQMRRLV